MSYPKPYKHHWQFKYDDHQFGFLDISVDGEGKGRLDAKFSNGKKLDGDHFGVRIALLDNTGSAVAAHDMRKGLDGTLGKRTREGNVTALIRYKPGTSWSDVADMKVSWFRRDAIPDQAFWTTVAKVIQIILDGDEESKPSPEASHDVPDRRRPTT